jgi:hypothetical protein
VLCEVGIDACIARGRQHWGIETSDIPQQQKGHVGSGSGATF